MGYFEHLQAIFLIGPILGLLLVGFLVSLRSGVVSLLSPQGVRLFLGNLSQILIRLLAYLAGLLAVQRFIGFPIELIW